MEGLRLHLPLLTPFITFIEALARQFRIFPMPTLVIHAPKDKAQPENSRSFETIFMLGVGDGYAIPHNLFAQLSPGCGVVLLNKVSEKRAEGNLVKLVQTGKIDNDVGIYDVHFDNIKMVPYKTERLDKNGVAVISTSQPALPDHFSP